jgi:hypothetical protein
MEFARMQQLTTRFAVALWVAAFLSQTPATSSQTVKTPEITQSSNQAHLTVSGARPLVTALDALQNQYGWSVNYEDPQYVAKSDLVESTDARYANAAAGTRPHVPNGGLFSMDFPLGDGSGPDEATTLKSLIEAYNKTSNPGQFELRGQGTRFDVVGVAARDDLGKLKKQSPPLDSVITLSPQESRAIDGVTFVCEQISKLTSLNLSVGVYPRNLFNRPLKIGTAEKLPARDALSKIFAMALPGKEKNVSWRLLYDPDLQTYVLNVHLRK